MTETQTARPEHQSLFRRFNMRSVSPWITCGAMLGALFTPTSTKAQDANGGVDQADFRPDEGNAEVYVNDSFEASDTIARAETLAQRGQWREAAVQLQAVSDSSEGKLIRIAEGRYEGVRSHINRLIAQWPAVGLRTYRSLYDQVAQDSWDELVRQSAGPGADHRGSKALSELVSLFDRYFCTSTSVLLADAIAQRAIEQSDLVLAARIYERVLADHPDRDEHRLRLRAMLSIVNTMQGHDIGPVDEKLQQQTIRWKGVDRTVGDLLSSIGEEFAALHAQTPADVWPTFGGDVRRNRRTDTNVAEPGLLWRFSFVDAEHQSADDGNAESDSPGGDLGHRLTLNPVADETLVYVQRGRNIVALHRNTGVVAWKFQGDDPGATPLSFLDDRTPGWDGATLYSGRIYAALPGDPVPYYSYESAGNPAELVCLDAKNGREIWRLEQHAIEEQFAEIAFDSSPVIYRDYLLVVGRRRRSFGFEDAYLYCFDANHGTLRYRTHLGSASTGTFGSRLVTRAVVSVLHGRALVCTNLGTVAAVSLHTGEVDWLRVYARNRRAADSSTTGGKSAKPWQLNPILVAGDRLVVLPRDATDVLILAVKDGALLKTFSTNDLGGMQNVLGVADRVLCGTGSSIGCFDIESGLMQWQSDVPADAPLYGRGVWAGDRLLIPTHDSLNSYDIRNGQSVSLSWDADGAGGNLLALPNELLVAGADRISMYVRRHEIWQALQQRMADAPQDPIPALELAEVALNSGDGEQAVTMLDEAVRRVRASGSLPEDVVRKRLFDDALLFVDRLDGKSELDKARLDHLFDIAAAYPPTPESHLQYRLRFAQLYERRDDARRAVRLYHQILVDRSLRDLVIDPRDGGAATAGQKAATMIADLLEHHGRSIYEEFEQQARDWLSRAKNDRDTDLLARIAQTFPNSESAPLALITHGDILRDDGKPLAAAEKYAVALHRYERAIDHPVLLRKIADAYESAGRKALAYRWLTKAAREHPSVRSSYDNHLVTFLEYRQRIEAVRKEIVPTRPLLRLPIEQVYVQAFPDQIRLLPARFMNVPRHVWSTYFVATDTDILAYDAKTGKERWSFALGKRGQPELLIATQTAAVFAGTHTDFAVDMQSGRLLWSDNADVPDPNDAMADWENANRLRTHAIHEDRLLSVRDSGQITCRRLEDGEILWSKSHRPAPAGQLDFSDRWVVYHVVQDGKPVICLLDAATGDWAGAILTDESHSIENLSITFDGRVLAASSGSISSFDPVSRRLRWNVPLSGRLRRSSLHLDIDSLYFSDNGHRIVRLNVEDGKRLWESERIVPRGDDDMVTFLTDGSLLVGSTSSVTSIDTVTGLTLWRGTRPEDSRFQKALLTQTHLVAVDIPTDPVDMHSTAYFYNNAKGSGIIDPNGGATELGVLEDVREIMIVDGALLVQTGSTIRGWRTE